MGGKESQKRRLERRKRERVEIPFKEDTSLRKDDTIRKRREEYWNKALRYDPEDKNGHDN